MWIVGVFINYRGEDSHSYAALLYTHLARRFGHEQVFLDAESIPAGGDVAEELLGRVRSAQVLLTVIGPRWLTATGPTGRRRIDDPADWIRRELADAFAVGVRVIPVLIDGAELPHETELPADIAALSGRQYRRLRHRDADVDLARIVTDLTGLDLAFAAAAPSRETVPRQLAGQFGALLRQLRQQNALTQEDLAERSGLSVLAIRRLEADHGFNPWRHTVRLLADALELTPEERAQMSAVADGLMTLDSSGVAGIQSESAFEGRLAEATDDLAHAVRARWRREEELRRIQDPFPLPVGWRRAPDDVMDYWENIRRVSPGESADPLDLAGDLPEITDIFRRIPSGRLVVLGRAGSGKSVLAVRFVLDLLQTRSRGDAVPVVFSLGSWNPTTTGFQDWLAGQLVRDHPGLAVRSHGGSSLATLLVEAGRILPVLDGFDELASGLRRAALDALDATTLPLLLTSRPGEYASVAATGRLTAAAVVRLTDLTLSDVADYLARTTRGSSGVTVWDPVLTQLLWHPERRASVNLGEVLTTPLMVGLARAIYSDAAGRDPSELLDTDRFGSQDDLEDYLLGSFVPTVYRDRHSRWDPDRAQRWFSYLARHLNQLETRDLAWSQLGAVRRSSRTIVVAVVIGLLLGLSGGLVGVLRSRSIDGPLSGLLLGLAAGLILGVVQGVGGAFAGTAFEPSSIRLRIPGTTRSIRRTFIPRFLVGLVFGFTLWLSGGLGRGPLVGTFVGLLGAAVVGLVWGLMPGLESPIDTESAATPAGLLRSTRTTAACQMLVLGLVVGVTVGLTQGLWAGLALGAAGGLGFALALTAWGRWVVLTRLWLPLTGRLPWAVIAFLDDACRRGVLRQAGGVYQFRHSHLQDHLAGVSQPQDGHSDTGAGSVGSVTVTVTIYLSDEAAHQRVEAAVEDFLASAGAVVDHRDEPILGSWFRRLRARLARTARSPLAREALITAAHLADARLVLAQDAAVTADLLSHLGPVIAALESTKEAVIRTGALLIVKIDDKVAVHQLTASQQLQLDHQPALATSAREILTTLQLGFNNTANHAAGTTPETGLQAANPAPHREAPRLSHAMTTRMPVLSFPGGYEDDRSVESVTWRIEPSDRNSAKLPRFEIHTIVRGVSIWGLDFDSLKPSEPDAAEVECLTLNLAGELDKCLLRGDLPCTIDIHGKRQQSAVHFALDLRNARSARRTEHLHLSVIVDGMTFAVTDEWFEDGLQRLEDALPGGVRLTCCLTCRYSHYSSGGHGLLGIACHRGAKAEYLAARSHADYGSVPVTEEVPEIYLCPDYERRIQG
jgi:transcriptional regulator with XRE-family HTH domain